MMRKMPLFIAVFAFTVMSVAAEITAENYQGYIGKKIKFNPNTETSELYKIGIKTFDNKKYSGTILTIANIEKDKKGNLILFLTQELENEKAGQIKVKTKAPQATLQNIIVIEDLKPQKKEVKTPTLQPVLPSQTTNKAVSPPAVPVNNNINYATTSSESSFFIWFIIGGFIVAFFIFFREKVKSRKLIATVTTRPAKAHMGASAERDLILKLLKSGIPAETIFHDLYLKKPNGNFSQIDVVAVTQAGIIVFEVKDYSGWIFGNGKHSQWTKVLAFGKEKYRFYNPIMQNNWHIAALRKQLKHFAKVPLYSVIVFYGDCELKDITFVPEGAFIVTERRVLDVVNKIINKNSPVHYMNKEEVIKRLKASVKNGDSEETQERHIENVKDMLGKDRIYR